MGSRLARSETAHAVGAKAGLIRVDPCKSVSPCFSASLRPRLNGVDRKINLLIGFGAMFSAFLKNEAISTLIHSLSVLVLISIIVILVRAERFG